MALPALRRLAAACACGGHELRLVGRPIANKVLDGQGDWPDVARSWRRQRGSAAVLLAASIRVALAARRVGARVVVGTRVDARRWLLTHPVDGTIADCHQRELYARTADVAIAALGGTPAYVGVADGFVVEERGLDWWRAVGRPRVVLHPWAEGAAAKRWPLARWIELGCALRSFGAADATGGPGSDASVAVTGGPGAADAALARSVADAIGAPCAAGEGTLSPRAWAAVAQRATVICPDTGVGHLAAAAGGRPVVLFGATDPDRYAPPGALVVAGASMRAVGVEDVLAAALAADAGADPEVAPGSSRGTDTAGGGGVARA